MSLDPRCPQCAFVSRQLGQPTPCLLHVSLAPDATVEAPAPIVTVADQHYDEPYTFGELRLTVDRLGPFSLREYVRLQLLRTRIANGLSPLDLAVTEPPSAAADASGTATDASVAGGDSSDPSRDASSAAAGSPITPTSQAGALSRR
jgi:hypothetical protein